jgi:hypothetical protein
LENSNGKKTELLNSLKKKRKERKEGRKQIGLLSVVFNQ